MNGDVYRIATEDEEYPIGFSDTDDEDEQWWEDNDDDEEDEEINQQEEEDSYDFPKNWGEKQ
jgi:hypothetical protein